MTPEVSIANKGISQIFKETFKENFFYYQGRASRREFWLFQLALLIVYFAFCIIIGFLIGIGSVVLGFDENQSSKIIMVPIILFMLIIIIPSICLAIRRLHDAGYTGWLVLLSVIPFLSLIAIIFYVLPSQEGTNKYGLNPYDTGDNKEFIEEKLKENPAFNVTNKPNYKA